MFMNLGSQADQRSASPLATRHYLDVQATFTEKKVGQRNAWCNENVGQNPGYVQFPLTTLCTIETTRMSVQQINCGESYVQSEIVPHTTIGETQGYLSLHRINRE